LHAASRILDALFEKGHRPNFGQTIAPLVVLSVFVLPTGGLWPLFNQLWTGDWKTNVYTLLWPYDIVGFGPGHGIMEGGHTLEYGWRNARADLVVYMRDLFGLTLSPGIEKYAEDNWGWGAGIGISWLLVLAGLV